MSKSKPEASTATATESTTSAQAAASVASSEPVINDATAPSNPLLTADITHLAEQLNDALDLPWVPEVVEQKWIEWVLIRVVKVVPVEVVAIITSAADGLSLEDLQVLEDKIVKLANDLIDIPMIPEGVEEGLIRPIVRQLLTFAQTGRSLSLAK